MAYQVMAQQTTTPYPSIAPIEQYLMERTAGIALARTAAPESISGDAEVLVLGRHGFETAVIGKNGFVCIVERWWTSAFFNFRHVSVLPFAAVSLLLILTTIGASYLPARRASRIDPLQALREE
jgi:ABC-type antimicrobial peptide transport system permease subunit